MDRNSLLKLSLKVVDQPCSNGLELMSKSLVWMFFFNLHPPFFAPAMFQGCQKRCLNRDGMHQFKWWELQIEGCYMDATVLWTLDPVACEYGGSFICRGLGQPCLSTFFSISVFWCPVYVCSPCCLFHLGDCLPPSGQFSADQKLIFETVAARGPCNWSLTLTRWNSGLRERSCEGFTLITDYIWSPYRFFFKETLHNKTHILLHVVFACELLTMGPMVLVFKPEGDPNSWLCFVMIVQWWFDDHSMMRWWWLPWGHAGSSAELTPEWWSCWNGCWLCDRGLMWFRGHDSWSGSALK